ncbi:MAG: hypothetical protein ACKPHU_14245, partial [Planctomycetaceae bacterium]
MSGGLLFSIPVAGGGQYFCDGLPGWVTDDAIAGAALAAAGAFSAGPKSAARRGFRQTILHAVLYTFEDGGRDRFEVDGVRVYRTGFPLGRLARLR